MKEMKRRETLGLLGASFVSGCLDTLQSDPYSAPDSVSLGQCGGLPEWSTFQGSPRRTGQADIAMSDEPEVVNHARATDSLYGTSMVVCTEEYVCWHQEQGRTIYRTHTSTGRTDSFSLESAVRVGPVLGCSRLGVHTNSGVKWIDIDEWEVVSETPTASPHTGTLIDRSLAYIPEIGGGLQAYSIKSGKQQWFVEAKRLITGLSSSRDAMFVVDSNSSGGRIMAVEKTNGEIRWQNDAIGETYSNPVVGSHILVRDDAGTLHALSKDIGEVRWSIKSNATGPYPIPAYRDGAVYLPDGAAGTLVAIDSETGEQLWRTQLTTENDGDDTSVTLSSPICTVDSVLVGASPGGLVAFDRETGEKRWQNATYSLKSNLAVTNDSVYALGTNGVVEATLKKAASSD